MSMTVQPQPDRPDPSVIAAQNDAFRKFACLGILPAQPCLLYTSPSPRD